MRGVSAHGRRRCTRSKSQNGCKSNQTFPVRFFFFARCDPFFILYSAANRSSDWQCPNDRSCHQRAKTALFPHIPSSSLNKAVILFNYQRGEKKASALLPLLSNRNLSATHSIIPNAVLTQNKSCAAKYYPVKEYLSHCAQALGITALQNLFLHSK